MEDDMNNLFLDTQIGKKNIIFGAFLFLLFALVIGVPLTLNFFGIPVLSVEQYQLWKVVHGYGIFLAVINYLLGTSVDGLSISGRQKEVLSWSFIIAGLFGAVVRMTLVLVGMFEDWHLFASLGEVAFFSVGLAIFIYGWTRKQKLAFPGEPVAETSVRDRRPRPVKMDSTAHQVTDESPMKLEARK
jgi:hypothetical protein